jgi:hypothetical protein
MAGKIGQLVVDVQSGVSLTCNRLLLFSSLIYVQVTLRPTVSQSVCFGVEPRLGLMIRFFFPHMKVTVLSIWGTLSHERSGLSFISHSPY